MANVQKYTKGNVQGLSIHWDRKTENHANRDIDNSRSHLNYDLCTKEGDSLSRLNKRLKEVHCLNRKDVNHCACWIVTLPEVLKGKTPEEQRLFFEKTYAFLTDRYGGEKNVITATVHNDETTPHMHFAFVPTMFDVKRGMDKVCAKKVVSRKDLSSFHGDLDHFLKAEIPHIYQGGILNDKTIGIEDVKSLKKQSEAIQQEKEKLDKVLDNKMKAVAKKENEIYRLDGEKAYLVEKVNELKEKSTWITPKIQLKAKKERKKTSLFGKEEETGNWIVEDRVYRNANRQMLAAHQVVEHYKELLETDFARENQKLKEQLQEVTKERDELVQENKELVTKLKEYAIEMTSAYDGIKAFLKEQYQDTSIFKTKLTAVVAKVVKLAKLIRGMNGLDDSKTHFEKYHTDKTRQEEADFSMDTVKKQSEQVQQTYKSKKSRIWDRER